MSAALDFIDVRHGYDRQIVLDGLSLHVPEGRVTCLLGPSGCGKTTLLRIAAGLERPWSGRVLLGGREVDGDGVHVPPEQRGIGFVFQDFALFPHLDVLGNVAFGIRAGSRADRHARARALLEQLGIGDKEDVHPHLLSGGQQQRVALARAMAPDPAMLLLDEPFSGLDTVLRRGVYEDLRNLLGQTGVTAVVVTHDPVEAMILGHGVVLMNQGRIEQQGTPEALYQRPANPFVMRFLGEANTMPAHREGGDAVTPLGRYRAPAGDEPLCAMVRPERIAVTSAGGQLAHVVSSVFLGRAVRLHLDLDGLLLTAEVPADRPYVDGDTVSIGVDPADMHLFPA